MRHNLTGGNMALEGNVDMFNRDIGLTLARDRQTDRQTSLP